MKSIPCVNLASTKIGVRVPARLALQASADELIE
jgi:hypothetical protein